jgi:hypothetical protein
VNIVAESASAIPALSIRVFIIILFKGLVQLL